MVGCVTLSQLLTLSGSVAVPPLGPGVAYEWC